jgi:hypothetical protein
MFEQQPKQACDICHNWHYYHQIQLQIAYSPPPALPSMNIKCKQEAMPDKDP